MSYEKLINVSKIEDYFEASEIKDKDSVVKNIQTIEAMLDFQRMNLSYEELEEMIKVEDFLTKPGPTNLTHKISEARKIESIPAPEFDYI